ncbi:hypothetical protein SynA1562_01790 [Synechococcus sp. A15-62]|nr:hypothetical protein SynA1562_01790 [Synechococcus sp. A15-62]
MYNKAMNIDRQQAYVRYVQYFHENPQNMLIGINEIYTCEFKILGIVFNARSRK